MIRRSNYPIAYIFVKLRDDLMLSFAQLLHCARLGVFVFFLLFFFWPLHGSDVMLSTCKMATHHRQNAAGRRKVQVNFHFHGVISHVRRQAFGADYLRTYLWSFSPRCVWIISSYLCKNQSGVCDLGLNPKLLSSLYISALYRGWNNALYNIRKCIIYLIGCNLVFGPCLGTRELAKIFS